MAQFTPVGVTAMVKGHGQFKADLASMGKSIQQTGGFAGNVKGQFLGLGDSVLNVGKTAAMVAAGGIAALGAGLTAIVATSVGVAARVSEMNRVIHFMGEESGYTTEEVDKFVQSLVDEGIRLDVAQEVAAKFIQRNLDMAKATELAKVAAGGAIIANEDTSDSLRAIIDAITTNNVLMLRRRNIQVDATQAYEEYVKAEGKGTQATIDNSEAIAEQIQDISFLERELAMAEQAYHDANAELIHAREWYAEGSVEMNKFQKRVDSASLALDKKRAKLAEVKTGLNELQAAHGAVDKSIKVTTDDLSGEERSAAFLNAVLKDGQKLIPLYAEAMKEPSKKARSLKRHFFDLRVAIGKQFLEAFGTVIDTLTDLVKHMKITLAEGGLFNRFFQFLAGIVVKAVDALSRIVPTFKAFTNLVEAGTSPMRALAIAMANFIGPEATQNILPFMDSLDQLILKIGELFAAFATGGLGGVAEVLGFGEQFQAMSDMIAQAVAFVMEHFEAFKSALLGIGVVLAGAAITALVVGLGAAIAGLLTPINLIIAAVALVGAAWSENWFGIREAVAALVDFFTPAINTLKQGFADFLVALEPLGPILQDFLPVLGEIAQFIGAVLLVAIRGLIAGLGELLPYIGHAFVAAVEAATTIITSFVDFIKGAFQMIKGIIIGDMDMAREGAQQVLSSLADALVALLQGLIQIVGTLTFGLWDAIVGIWESIKDALVGGSIVVDLIDSIVALFKGLPDAILGALGGLIDKISGVFKDLFGPILEFDPSQVGQMFAKLLTGLQELTEVWLVFMQTLNETWLVFSAFLLEESWPTIQTAWTDLNILMTTIWAATMQALTVALIQFVTVALAQLQLLLNRFNQIVVAIRQMIAALADAKAALEDFVSDAIRGDLDDLLDRIEDLADEFRALADAIREAAEAAESAGAGGGGGGPGLQRGGSFTVPSGVGPEGVPIRVHRLERVTVIPAGQAGMAGAGTEYNFNLNVATRDTAAGVIQEFFIARALLAA